MVSSITDAHDMVVKIFKEIKEAEHWLSI